MPATLYFIENAADSRAKLMESPGDDIIRRVSMVDNVTERLRRALLSGDIKPGERIKVSELEKTLGVSHIPIREALRRLETEGLIVALPQRAAVAAGVDLDDLAGLYGLRKIVECEVIRQSVETMTDDDVERIRAALEALVAVAQDHDSPRFWELHRDFHWSLLEPGATAWVRRVLDQAWLASQRYVRLFVAETLEDAMRDHHELVAACEARDAEHAVELLRLHLDRTEQAVGRAFLASNATGA